MVTMLNGHYVWSKCVSMEICRKQTWWKVQGHLCRLALISQPTRAQSTVPASNLPASGQSVNRKRANSLSADVSFPAKIIAYSPIVDWWWQRLQLTKKVFTTVMQVDFFFSNWTLPPDVFNKRNVIAKTCTCQKSIFFLNYWGGFSSE